MKTNKLLKTALLSVCLMGGVSASWAENVSIPQDLGSYIVIGSSTGDDGFASYITKKNCLVDTRLGDAGNSKYYTIGSTRSNTKVTFNITANEAGDYAFGFKSGAEGCSSVVTVKMTKSGSDTPIFSQDITIANDGNWDPNISHVLFFTGLEATNYTLQFDVKEITSGYYAGNFGNFYFHKMSQLAWPTSSSYMELSDGTFKNATDNDDNVINYIKREGGYIDDLLVYNDTEHDYLFCFNIDAKKQDAKVKITVSDFDSGVQEAQSTIIVLTAGDYKCPLSSKITTGLKKVRFDFLDNDETADDSHLYNFRQVYFESYTYDALPLTGTATLNLNQTTAKWNNCSYETGEEDNIGYIKGTTPYADNYYVNNTNEGAYYDLFANISWHNTNGSTLKVTIFNVETGAEEATGTSSSIDGTGIIHFALNNAITAGAKKIRFDFVHATETSAYLYNVKEISFYKRSLNENYDYTPVAATGVDVVLTRNLSSEKWATIVLPFAMTSEQITSAFGSGTKVAQLKSEGTNESTLNFETVSAIEANKPYAIKVGTTVSEAKNISGVTIVEGTTTQSLTDWDFVGTYESGNIPDGSYFFSGNKLWQASGDAVTIKPFRAYFTPKVAAARQVLFVIEGEEGETSIGRINADGTMETVAEGPIFNLAGQRVANPTKGLYIVNGKKVIIK